MASDEHLAIDNKSDNSDNNEAGHDATEPTSGAPTTSRSCQSVIVFAVLAAITAVVAAASTPAGSGASLPHGRSALLVVSCKPAHHAAQVNQLFAEQHVAIADADFEGGYNSFDVAYPQTHVANCSPVFDVQRRRQRSRHRPTLRDRNRRPRRHRRRWSTQTMCD